MWQAAQPLVEARSDALVGRILVGVRWDPNWNKGCGRDGLR